MPGYVDKAENQNFNNTPSVVIPAGASVGQRALLFLDLAGSNISVQPTGWTSIDSDGLPGTAANGRLLLWHGVITSGGDLDPGATVNITLAGTSRWTMSVVVYGPSDVTHTAAQLAGQPATTTHVSPASTADGPNARVVSVYGGISDDPGAQPTWTPDAATTARVSTTWTSGTSRNSVLLVADEVKLSAGATSPRTATSSLPVQPIYWTIVLEDAVTRPIANAGPDQQVDAGDVVNLDGSATAGGGAGAPYTWLWTQTGGTPVTLNDATAENPSFTAPGASAVLTFDLVATDVAAVQSLPDPVTITVIGPENTVVPDEDKDTGDWTVGWTKQPPGALNFYSLVADNDDATYVQSPDNPSDAAIIFGLKPMTQPVAGDTVVVSARLSLANASSGSADIYLFQGASSSIAAWLDEPIAPGGVIETDNILAPGQLALITDPLDLWVLVVVSAVA